MSVKKFLDSILKTKEITPSIASETPKEMLILEKFTPSNWLDIRRSHLKDGLIAIRGKRKLVVRQSFFMLEREIADVEVIPESQGPISGPCDIYFSQGYAPDHNRLIQARKSGLASIIACWFWDNHHLIPDTLKSASISDITFYAHYFNSYYIKNTLSIDGAFVPLCPVFWTESAVEQATEEALLTPRSDLLYGGYNSYPEFPDRDLVINRVQELIPSNQIFFTPHGTSPDEHPYYGLSPRARLLEWMTYKVSLCVSFDRNTAMRMFDALLGGGIPLVLGKPADLDMIIPPSEQSALPVVVLEDPSPEGVPAAYQHCLRLFDEGGLEGVVRRQQYILNNHMPYHRLNTMIRAIRDIAERAEEVDNMMGA